jgi:hypothetical protein
MRLKGRARHELGSPAPLNLPTPYMLFVPIAIASVSLRLRR